MNLMIFLKKKVKSEGENPLQFSRFTLPGITEKYNQVKKDMVDKKNALAQERKRQETNENLVKEFNNKCKEYLTWGNDAIKALQKETDGSLEDQLSVLQKEGPKYVNQSNTLLGKLVQSAGALEEADIIEMSEHTVQELQALDDQIKTIFSKKKNKSN